MSCLVQQMNQSCSFTSKEVKYLTSHTRVVELKQSRYTFPVSLQSTEFRSVTLSEEFQFLIPMLMIQVHISSTCDLGFCRYEPISFTFKLQPAYCISYYPTLYHIRSLVSEPRLYCVFEKKLDMLIWAATKCSYYDACIYLRIHIAIWYLSAWCM